MKLKSHLSFFQNTFGGDIHMYNEQNNSYPNPFINTKVLHIYKSHLNGGWFGGLVVMSNENIL